MGVLMKKLLEQLVWFVLVGCAAAATHWGTTVYLVESGYWTPAWSNLVGWVVAFGVSFSGHYFLTFRHQHKAWRSSVVRFAGVSLFGFLVNEMAFVSLLHWTRLSYEWVLAGVLVGVAVFTFVLGRYWAFRDRTQKT
jgi:putative flippase GtrA